MRPIIDVALDVSSFAEELRRRDVECVIRYYNHQNSARLPTKRLTESEARALHEVGISLAVVFQQSGGAQGDVSALTSETGLKDSRRALELARGLGQPKGSAIYFAVDHDYLKSSDLLSIEQYFKAVRDTLAGEYMVGCYGSGTVAGRMRTLGHADYIWLSGSTAWSGTRSMLGTDQWALFQKDLNVPFPAGGFFFDGNVQSPAFPNFGQFTLDGPAADAPQVRTRTLMEVTARGGLLLRSGPGQSFDKLATLPRGKFVEGIRRVGEWIEVDLEGDGASDGYMHSGFLRPVSGGLSEPVSPGLVKPLDVARAEMAKGIAEVSGAVNNPRIVHYHSTTRGGGLPDEVAWCSSFVNFCVEQAGLRGTDSKWAKSWHDAGWGQDVTNDPKEGDIAVFERRRGSATGEAIGGHVGFWLGSSGAKISLLGGNQSNRVSITDYPAAGILGTNFYRLLSIRRAS
jgi:uncharacterized protein (TIGR02594 family)